LTEGSGCLGRQVLLQPLAGQGVINARHGNLPPLPKARAVSIKPYRVLLQKLA
jgi:hypothetical protein